MSCDCPKCNCSDCDGQTSSGSSSSFIFGLVLGAIVGAIIAIVIYRQNKGKIFDDLQKKLEDFFKNLIGESTEPKTKSDTSKKPEVTTKTITFVKKKSIPKTFVKSKK